MSLDGTIRRLIEVYSAEWEAIFKPQGTEAYPGLDKEHKPPSTKAITYDKDAKTAFLGDKEISQETLDSLKPVGDRKGEAGSVPLPTAIANYALAQNMRLGRAGRVSLPGKASRIERAVARARGEVVEPKGAGEAGDERAVIRRNVPVIGGGSKERTSVVAHRHVFEPTVHEPGDELSHYLAGGAKWKKGTIGVLDRDNTPLGKAALQPEPTPLKAKIAGLKGEIAAKTSDLVRGTTDNPVNPMAPEEANQLQGELRVANQKLGSLRTQRKEQVGGAVALGRRQRGLPGVVARQKAPGEVIDYVMTYTDKTGKETSEPKREFLPASPPARKSSDLQHIVATGHDPITRMSVSGSGVTAASFALKSRGTESNELRAVVQQPAQVAFSGEQSRGPAYDAAVEELGRRARISKAARTPKSPKPKAVFKPNPDHPANISPEEQGEIHNARQDVFDRVFKAVAEDIFRNSAKAINEAPSAEDVEMIAAAKAAATAATAKYDAAHAGDSPFSTWLKSHPEYKGSVGDDSTKLGAGSRKAIEKKKPEAALPGVLVPNTEHPANEPSDERADRLRVTRSHAAQVWPPTTGKEAPAAAVAAPEPENLGQGALTPNPDHPANQSAEVRVGNRKVGQAAAMAAWPPKPVPTTPRFGSIAAKAHQKNPTPVDPEKQKTLLKTEIEALRALGGMPAIPGEEKPDLGQHDKIAREGDRHGAQPGSSLNPSSAQRSDFLISRMAQFKP